MGRLSGTQTTPTQPVSGGRLSGGRLSGTPIKADLKSVEGLEQTAIDRGLEDKLENVPTQGEKPDEIFSGGVFMDVMDVLNASQYGVTGLLKGKSFSEGVKTRQSFSDKDALGDHGLPGVIGGIALDIAVDPLTYLGGFGILKRVATAGAKGVKAVGSGIASSNELAARGGDFFGKHLIYRYGQDPVYKELAERTVKSRARSVQNVVEMNRVWNKLDGTAQRAVAEARKAGGKLGLVKQTPKLVDEIKPSTVSGVNKAEDVLDLQADDIMGKLSGLKADNFVSTAGKVNLELFEEAQKIVGRAEKAGLDPVDARRGAEILQQLGSKKTFVAKTLPKIPGVSDDVMRNVDEVFQEADRLALEFADVAPLPTKLKAAFRNNVGSFLRRSYKVFEDPSVVDKGKQFIGSTKPQRAEDALFKSRKDLPEEVREALGEIKEAGYPTAKSMAQLAKSIEDMKFFKQVAVNPAFASKTAKAGFTQLPTTPRLGDLSGMHVPGPIADDINEIIRTRSAFDKTTGKIVGTFKFSKVILNPATHARNIMSNAILNNFEGMNPLDPRAAKAYALAAKEISKKGKWYKEAQKQGLGLDSFAANEIRGFLRMPEISRGKKVSDTVRKSLNKMADLYQKEEEFAKMAQYIFQRTAKAASPEDAWRTAERATFNYAQVTPTIRKLRESIFGYPFITFTYKATPQVAKTLATKPTKISNIGKIKEGIENLSDQEQLKEERAVEPTWVRNGFYVKLPGEDKFGRSKYLDLTYILPFGDLVSGQLFSRDIDNDTGLREGVIETGVKKLAFPNMVKELVENEDFFGNKIFKESDDPTKQGGDIMLYLTRQLTPPLVGNTLPGGFREDGERKPSVLGRTQDLEEGGTERGGKQTRTAQQEILRNIGLKINPFDVDTQSFYSDLNHKKALETLLIEEGEIGNFDIKFDKK